MSTQPVLIAGQWRPADATGVFQADNPATAQPLAPIFPVSSWADVDRALQAATAAAEALRATPPERIADFLERYATLIEERREPLVATAHAETALPANPRLNDVELPRTSNQLREAARGAQRQLALAYHRHQARHSLVPRAAGPGVGLWPQQFSVCLQQRRRRRLCRRHCHGQSRDRQGQLIAPRDHAAVGGRRARSGEWCRPAHRQRATYLSHQPCRRRTGRGRCTHRGHGLHRQPPGRPGAEGSRRPIRQAHLSGTFQHQSCSHIARRPAHARRRHRRRVLHQLPDGSRTVLHQSRAARTAGGRRDRRLSGRRRRAIPRRPGRHAVVAFRGRLAER